jgi:hypothetical protein
MNSRVIVLGIIFGLLISLAELYPAISLVAPLSSDGWLRPIQSELGHGIALMISSGAALLLTLGFGVAAARYGRAPNIRLGAKMGGVAGLIVGYLTFVTIYSPLLALFAHNNISAYPPSPGMIFPPSEALDLYIAEMVYTPTLVLVGSLLIYGIIGGITGGIAIWRIPPTYPVRLSLSEHLSEGQSPRRWLPEDTQAIEVAVFAGLVFGTIFTFFEAQLFNDLTNMITTMPALFFNDKPLASNNIPGSIFVNTVLPILALVGMAMAVVYFMRNPNYRLFSRTGATMLAAATSTMPLVAVNLRYLLLWLGLAPYLAFYALERWLAMPMAIDDVSLEEALLWANQMRVFAATQMASPYFFGTAAFVVPWIVITVLVTTLSIMGIALGLIFGMLIPLVRPAPVDKAAKIQRRIRLDPTQTLPELQQLFLRDGQAYDVLAFVATGMYKPYPEVAQVAAALHTLGTSTKPEEHITAVVDLETVTNHNPHWQWANSFNAIYHSFKYVLQAHTIEEILNIPPVDQDSTATLPANVVQSVRHLNNIIGELHKVEKVDDLRTKIIFLENSLKAMRQGVEMIDELRQNANTTCLLAPPPDHNALETVLTHWQTIALEAIQRMKGRASVSCHLKNERTPLATQIPLVYEISNHGLNVAQKVRLRVRENNSYQLLNSGNNDIYIEILPPGESRQVTTAIAPSNGQRRLRVEWTISYDDAVDTVRELEFADVLEFVDPDKPYQRIFPIPYVTGTPLKSDDVFVGREDVFAFIRENLLGAHQNNAIILHGQRRTGKTSVLYRLGRVMTDTHYAVLIDMQGKPARGTAEFLYSIADDISYTLEEAGLDIEPPERKDFEEAPEFFFRNRFLRQLKPILGDKNLLLLFDEFEELQRRVEDGRLPADIFTFLRNLMQHENHVDFVFSGTHKLEQLGAEYWSVLFNIAVYKPITFLSPNEVRRLVTEPIKQYSLEYDPLAVQKIARVAAGHPYFTQLILHEAIVYHNETEQTYLTVTDIDQVLHRIVERGEAHFKYIWAESSHEEQTILRGLTECLVATEAITLKQLQKFLQERGITWGEAWDLALNSLLDRDIVTRGAMGSSLLRFKVDLIRLWIEQTRPPL